MIPAKEKKDPMEQLLASLVKRGWIKSEHRTQIKSASDVPAVVEKLRKRGDVSDGVARTIVRRHKAEATKNNVIDRDHHGRETYDDVIERHIAKVRR